MFNRSTQKPSRGKYRDSENARIVDTYDLWENNCTTKSIEAIQISVENGFDIEEISPVNLKNSLNAEIKNGNPFIKRINVNQFLEEYDEKD